MLQNKNKLKPNRILFILLSSVLQLANIPLFYYIGYGIALLFHKPYVRPGGDGMDFYALTLYHLTWFVIISIPIITIFQELIKNELVITIFHSAWFAFIVWMTFGDLQYRPYDYGLILLCVGTTIPTRIVIRRVLDK